MAVETSIIMNLDKAEYDCLMATDWSGYRMDGQRCWEVCDAGEGVSEVAFTAYHPAIMDLMCEWAEKQKGLVRIEQVWYEEDRNIIVVAEYKGGILMKSYEEETEV